MVSINVVERITKNKITSLKRTRKYFKSSDEVKQFVKPIVMEMKLAKREKREPKKFIDGVSYDSKSEKKLLCELGVIELNDPDSEY